MPASNDAKIIDDEFIISRRRGNGVLRREVWVDASGKVTRYNLAYVNHRISHVDNGRVIGYDNHHGRHHRHYMGRVESMDFTSFEEIEARFEIEWLKISKRG